jgi:hypothetical protein
LFHGRTLSLEVCAEQQPTSKLAIKISWTNIVIALSRGTFMHTRCNRDANAHE